MLQRLPREWGCEAERGTFRPVFPLRQKRRGLDREAGEHRAEGEEHGTDVMRIARPDDLADLAALGLTLAESKRLLAGVQRVYRTRFSGQ